MHFHTHYFFYIQRYMSNHEMIISVGNGLQFSAPRTNHNFHEQPILQGSINLIKVYQHYSANEVKHLLQKMQISSALF